MGARGEAARSVNWCWQLRINWKVTAELIMQLAHQVASLQAEGIDSSLPKGGPLNPAPFTNEAQATQSGQGTCRSSHSRPINSGAGI